MAKGTMVAALLIVAASCTSSRDTTANAHRESLTTPAAATGSIASPEASRSDTVGATPVPTTAPAAPSASPKRSQLSTESPVVDPESIPLEEPPGTPNCRADQLEVRVDAGGVYSGFEFRADATVRTAVQGRCVFGPGPVVRLLSGDRLVAEGRDDDFGGVTPLTLVGPGEKPRSESEGRAVSVPFGYGSSRACEEGLAMIDTVELRFDSGETVRGPASFQACDDGEVFPRRVRVVGE